MRDRTVCLCCKGFFSIVSGSDTNLALRLIAIPSRRPPIPNQKGSPTGAPEGTVKSAVLYDLLNRRSPQPAAECLFDADDTAANEISHSPVPTPLASEIKPFGEFNNEYAANGLRQIVAEALVSV